MTAALRVGSELAAAGRYLIFDELAAGGMATVHFGLSLSSAGFARVVAIKRMHAQFAKDARFVSMFLDEAQLAARVRHPNVVATLDVVSSDGELFQVMELVLGVTLGRLLAELERQERRVPPAIVVAVLSAVLHGLHAAHEAKTEDGEPLGLVHRDVSPQNILVGADGLARVFDFGVAKARVRRASTREGQIKGKLAYMAPEQILRSSEVDRRTDVFAAGVVLWEAVSGQPLFDGDNEGEIIHRVLAVKIPELDAVPAEVLPVLAVARRALAADPAERFATAREMALALETAAPPATASQVGDWVRSLVGSSIDELARRAEQLERDARGGGISAWVAPESPAGAVSCIIDPNNVLGTGGGRIVSSQVATVTTSPGPRGRGRRKGTLVLISVIALTAVAALVLARQRAEPEIEQVSNPTATSTPPLAAPPPAPPQPSSAEANEATVAPAAAPEKSVMPKARTLRTRPRPTAVPTSSGTRKPPSDFGF